MTYIILSVFLGLFVIMMALVAVHHSSLKVAILASGIVSLFSSILFLLLAAPDVAMTEASIGSGLTTIIFFYVLNKIQKNNA